MTQVTAIVEELQEKERLTNLILDFGWALDSGEWDLYRACLSDRICINFERLTGFAEVEVAAEDWTEFAKQALTPVRRHHAYTNLRIQISDRSAKARVHMVARHFHPSDNGSAENTQYGWYEFTFAKDVNSAWKITRVHHSFQWVSGNAGLFDFTKEPVASAAARVFNSDNLIN